MFNASINPPVELSDSEFRKNGRLVYDQCGIHLSNGKKELVKARLGKRIRKGRFPSFENYYHYVLHDPSGEELIHLLDSISTNFTSFFREPSHFEYLRSQWLPELIEGKSKKTRRLRFWSAGCSSGEEPYSIAMALLESLPTSSTWELRILATDISTKVLATATSGIYPKERVRTLPVPLVRKYFLKGERRRQDYVKIKDPVKQLVDFRRLNLMTSFHFMEPFDCIFCRNVMIYFDKKTQTSLVNRFYDCLDSGGVLLIGHSESLTGIRHPFHYVRPATYRKGVSRLQP